MAEVLKQEEIEQLLTALNEIEYTRTGILYTPSGDKINIRLYNFKRPEKLTTDNIDALNIIHKEMAGRLEAFFSDYLKKTIHIHVESIDELSLYEFKRCMPEPSCLSIINLHPLKGSAIIEIGPAIANSIVDIIFDGNGKNVKKNNALIDSEKFVMGKLIARSFDGLRESWKKIIEFNPELVSVETIASTVEISPPEAMGTLVSFECKMDDVEDMMSIYYPHRVIEPIKNKITSQFLASGIEAVNEPLKSATDRITIPVSAIIGTANLPLKAIEDLDIDNILELNKTIDKDIDIYAGGAIIARGEVVVIDDKFGIRITEIGNKNGNNNGK